MKKILLSQGFIAKVSDEDYEYLNQWTWSVDNHKASNTYYAMRISQSNNIKKIVWMHRVIAKRMGLIWNKFLEIDHKNRCGIDNFRENLHIVSHSSNIHNRNIQCNNTSGYKGVSFNKTHNYWRASIGDAGEIVFLGNFKTFEEAKVARILAEEKFAKLRDQRTIKLINRANLIRKDTGKMDGLGPSPINPAKKGRVHWDKVGSIYVVVEGDGSRAVDDNGYPLDLGGFDSLLVAEMKCNEVNASR